MIAVIMARSSMGRTGGFQSPKPGSSPGRAIKTCKTHPGRMMELVDMTLSKSVARKGVRVRVPLRLLQSRETVARKGGSRQAHNLKIAGSTPASAT